MQLKNDYTVRDAALLATHFYLEEKLAQHLHIYDVKGEDVEVMGTIAVPVLKIIEASDGELNHLIKEDTDVLEKMIFVEFCHIREATKSKILFDFKTIKLQQEHFIKCVLRFVDRCIKMILIKFKEYEDMLDVPPVIEDDITFASLTAFLLEDDFPTVRPEILAYKVYGMLYETFCRECGKMHNAERCCGTSELITGTVDNV